MSFISSSLNSYIKIMRIGQGAFGDVWLAEDVLKKRRVALKKLISKESRDGFSKSAIREIILLTNLKHKNIVDLHGVVFSRPRDSISESNDKDELNNTALHNFTPNYSNKGSIWMVFEYLPYDLSGYIEALKLEGKIIKVVDIKIILRQILSSLDYCHMNNIIHRDIKCANLLITSDGVVKLADFGLARLYNMCNRVHTNRVITLWYRPPELLLGAQCYDTPVDIWSVGCILGELILQQPLFCSENEAGVLKSIGDTFGFPPENVLSDLKKLPLWNDPDNNPLLQIPESCAGTKYKQFTSRVEEKVGKQGLDLLLRLLDYSPNNRLTAIQALRHPWLSNTSDEIIPDKLDMSIFSHKRQFHSLSARKLREKLHGRLKIAPNEIGGAANAIVGRAYNVGQIMRTIEERIKKPPTSETNYRQDSYSRIPTNETSIESGCKLDERQLFKRSRSKEPEGNLNNNLNKSRARNPSELKLTGYEKRIASNLASEEFERQGCCKDGKSDLSATKHELGTQDSENTANGDKRSQMCMRSQSTNIRGKNDSQYSTPCSPSTRPPVQLPNNSYKINIQSWVKDSPPLKVLREFPNKRYSTSNSGSNIHEHDRDRIEYNKDKKQLER